jgi:hypothetical protein
MSPCDYSKYPKNWKLLSKQVRERGGNACELCFVPNGDLVCRGKYGYWFHPPSYAGKGELKTRKIVLTVHHINYDTTDNREKNLIALCQRCHLRLDLPFKMANRKKMGSGVR